MVNILMHIIAISKPAIVRLVNSISQLTIQLAANQPITLSQYCVITCLS